MFAWCSLNRACWSPGGLYGGLKNKKGYEEGVREEEWLRKQWEERNGEREGNSEESSWRTTGPPIYVYI